MSKNQSLHKKYSKYYSQNQKILKKLQKALKGNNNEAATALQAQLDNFEKEFQIVRNDKVRYLSELNEKASKKLHQLSEQYDALSIERSKWMEKANLRVAPDGKLKTLRHLNKIGQRKGQKYVRRMIKVAEKMQDLENRINHRNQDIMQVEENKFVPLGFWARLVKFWKSIPYEKQQKIWGYIFCVPWVIGFLIFFLLPISESLWWSLNTVKPDKGVLEIQWNGLNNFKSLFTDYVDAYGNTFATVLANSLVSLTLNLIVVVIFSLIIAVLLNTKFKGHAFVKAIFFIPVVFNATAIYFATEGLGGRLSSSMSGNFTIANDFNNLLRNMSLPDRFTSFLVTAVNQIFSIVNMSGVQILIFLAAIQSVPASLYEAAKMEGATKYEMFWKITFPMVSPIFLTAAIYTIIDGFSKSSILGFYDIAKGQSAYGISSAVAVMYFLFTLVFIGAVYYIMKARLFYYDEK
ncbi:MAG: ABC transporter permease subunit [Bacilli bacterium]|jgi:ABC-type sugar transport system permease subunit